ncbi:hypothetical protein AGLY_011115 [Aphis glycines]|uniref:Uncharacterized protein n=1 Tax=Aphis glycines TaxID=307491 RepID=A0A6G0TCI4_APHGL|nr:hypothetical protein AGLY_011115 [Aphis glycines]
MCRHNSILSVGMCENQNISIQPLEFLSKTQTIISNYNLNNPLNINGRVARRLITKTIDKPLRQPYPQLQYEHIKIYQIDKNKNFIGLPHSELISSTFETIFLTHRKIIPKILARYAGKSPLSTAHTYFNNKKKNSKKPLYIICDCDYKTWILLKIPTEAFDSSQTICAYAKIRTSTKTNTKGERIMGTGIIAVYLFCAYSANDRDLPMVNSN